MTVHGEEDDRFWFGKTDNPVHGVFNVFHNGSRVSMSA